MDAVSLLADLVLPTRPAPSPGGCWLWEKPLAVLMSGWQKGLASGEVLGWSPCTDFLVLAVLWPISVERAWIQSCLWAPTCVSVSGLAGVTPGAFAQPGHAPGEPRTPTAGQAPLQL